MPQDDDSSTDLELFLKAVGTVKPVPQRHLIADTPKPSAEPRQSQRDERAVIDDMFSDNWLTEELQPGDFIEYSAGGLQHKVMKKLRQGKFRRDAEMDLHGLTAERARQALSQFLADADQNGWRCVKIIHGKGLRSNRSSPLIKSRLNSWLRQRRQILAFCSTPPADGGTGAVYVLLRKA